MRFALLVVGVAFPAVASAQPPTAEGLDFFERKIRPVLVEQCYGCHSADALKNKKLKGGLFLDSRAAVLKGGDTGPALIPGKPDDSLIIQALRHGDELRMPPKGKLPQAVIADFEKWIALGAPDPRDKTTASVGPDWEKAKRHWAYQPIRSPKIPAVKDAKWPANPVDAFILARLEGKGLSPSPAADRRTLLRRVYYDLIGIPPSADEVDAFLNDKTPDAYERVVDRLLASPHYGERWGRHWLDVARYADTKDGVLMYGDDRIRPYAYTYRDYVIKAFNEDLAFDRFIHEQLAADQIDPPVDPSRLAAMGFLTLGRMFDNNIHDILDDRIDVVSRGLFGLTVSCARCHDHKYDAVSTADYYSLYGVFASSEAPLELPLLVRTEGLTKEAADFEKKAGDQRKKVQDFLEQRYTMLKETARTRVGDYLLHAATTKPDPLETAVYFLSLAPEDLRPPIVARWRRYLDAPARADDPVFAPWSEVMKLPERELDVALPALVKKWRDQPRGTVKGQLNPLVAEALFKSKLSGRADVAKVYGELLRRIYEESKKSKLDAAGLQLVEIVAGPDSPCYFPKSQTRRYMSRGDTDAFGGMVQELDRMAVKSPHAPPRGMALVDAPEIVEPRIFVRGSATQLGERVPRQFLKVLAARDSQPFVKGSGRLELAKAITSPDNPLTARVLVNRVWMHHFGEPLVATPSDFGSRSTPPTHPELLDFLAWTVQQDGWSLKKLHRLLVLSRTYQQSSQDRPDCRKVDADNKLWWRAQRRRLDFESMRDTMLILSGRLDRTMHGRPVDIVRDSKSARRTVYALVDRQSLPGLFRAFDFAVPDGSVERRPSTTVPQQALFGLNSAFMTEQAKALAARPEVAKAEAAEKKVAALYRLVFARTADREEIAAGVQFIAEAEASAKGPMRSQLSAWEQYAQVLLLTNEVMFID